jgi:hypothetical protein
MFSNDQTAYRAEPAGLRPYLRWAATGNFKHALGA